MSKSTVKVVKYLIFFGIFAYCMYTDISAQRLTLLRALSDLFLASLAYLAASLFVFLTSAFQNYLLALIGTGALSVFIGYKIDDLVAAVPWLSTDSAALIIAIAVTLWIVQDIVRSVIGWFASRNRFEEPPAFDSMEAPTKTAQQAYKENPELMMKLSKELEQRRGYKPTYEELVDYVDNEAFHILTPEEARKANEDMLENMRKREGNQSS